MINNQFFVVWLVQYHLHRCQTGLSSTELFSLNKTEIEISWIRVTENHVTSVTNFIQDISLEKIPWWNSKLTYFRAPCTARSGNVLDFLLITGSVLEFLQILALVARLDQFEKLWSGQRSPSFLCSLVSGPGTKTSQSGPKKLRQPKNFEKFRAWPAKNLTPRAGWGSRKIQNLRPVGPRTWRSGLFSPNWNVININRWVFRRDSMFSPFRIKQ